ncbi:MAG: 6-bladed beta-propeller [bacterium]
MMTNTTAPDHLFAHRFSLCRFAVLWIVPVLLFMLTVTPFQALAGSEATLDGKLHIQNGSTPEHGVETLELEELWRVGGEDGEAIFGVVIQVLADAAGNIYLLDLQLSEVQVYSPDGDYIQTLSRQGEGPGEVNNPVDMVLMPNENLGLVQSFPGKIIKIDLQGNPAGDFTPGGSDPTQGGFISLIDAKVSGDGFLAGGLKILIDQEAGSRTNLNFVASFQEDGTENLVFAEHGVVFDFNDIKIHEKDNYFPHLRRWTAGADGRVYIASHRNQYAIDVYNADGSLDRIIEREFTSWQRNDKEMGRINAQMDATLSQIPAEVESSVETTEPDITAVRIADDGSLWILTSQGQRQQPDGIMLTYDVFDADGHFQKQVAVACPGDGVEDGLLFIGNRVVLVTGFTEALNMLQRQGAASTTDDEEEAEPMEIVCYQIK